MNNLLVIIFLSAVMLAPTLATAHHSAALLYHLDQDASVEGRVTRFSMGNPHARIYLMVTNEAGEEEEWLAEGGSRTVLLRSGWKGDEIKVGDTVTILGNPSRDGSNLIHWREVILQDGRELYGEDLNPYIIEDKRRNRDRD